MELLSFLLSLWLDGSCSVDALGVFLSKKFCNCNCKRLRRFRAHRSQLYQGTPKVRPQSNRSQKGHHPKLAVLVDKRINIRQPRTACIRDGLEAADRDAANLGEPDDRCRFHVDQDCAICIVKTTFFVLVSNTWRGHKTLLSIAISQTVPLAGKSVDHLGGDVAITGLHAVIE